MRVVVRVGWSVGPCQVFQRSVGVFRRRPRRERLPPRPLDGALLLTIGLRLLPRTLG